MVTDTWGVASWSICTAVLTVFRLVCWCRTLQCYCLTVRPISFRSQWSMALCMASNSSRLMWSVLSVVVDTPDTVNAFQWAPQPMFDAPVNNWVSGSVGVIGAPLRTLCADFHHWRSSTAGGKGVSTNCWLKHRNSSVERCNVGLRGCVAVPENQFFCGRKETELDLPRMITSSLA